MMKALLEGVVSIFNLQGSNRAIEQMRNRLRRAGIEPSDFNDDAQTIANDWKAVAGDIQSAIDKQKSPPIKEG